MALGSTDNSSAAVSVGNTIVRGHLSSNEQKKILKETSKLRASLFLKKRIAGCVNAVHVTQSK